MKSIKHMMHRFVKWLKRVHGIRPLVKRKGPMWSCPEVYPVTPTYDDEEE